MSPSSKHIEKKDFLISRGMEILWEKGYNGTSVNDIVKAADVPKGSFYFYFKSKEDFVVQALRQYFNEVYGEARKVLMDQSKTPLERILAFHEHRINVLLEEIESNKGCLACNMSSEVADQIPAIQEVVAYIHDQTLKDLIDVGKEAQTNGELSEDLDIEKTFAFLEDAGKGAMVTMKALGSMEPIENFKYAISRLL